MALKCKINARHAMLPVEGTVNEDGTKGQCPECLTRDRKLTGKGFVGAHNVVLDVDSTIPVTDEGVRVGAPRDAAVRREIEARQMRAGTRTVPQGLDVPDPVMTTGHGRGPTLVRGRAMEAAELTQRALNAVEEAREAKESGTPMRYAVAHPTCDGPLGRERADRQIITVPEPAPKRTPAQRERYRRKMRLKALKATAGAK